MVRRRGEVRNSTTKGFQEEEVERGSGRFINLRKKKVSKVRDDRTRKRKEKEKPVHGGMHAEFVGGKPKAPDRRRRRPIRHRDRVTGGVQSQRGVVGRCGEQRTKRSLRKKRGDSLRGLKRAVGIRGKFQLKKVRTDN